MTPLEREVKLAASPTFQGNGPVGKRTALLCVAPNCLFENFSFTLPVVQFQLVRIVRNYVQTSYRA